MTTHQLPLRVSLGDSATFANFLVGKNTTLYRILQQGEEPFVFLWGTEGSGKSHLLQAVCRQVQDSGESALYLPLTEPGIVPEMLDGLEQMSQLCLDGVDAIAGDPPWEQALFHLYNRMRDNGHRLLLAGNAAPGGIGVVLPDLVSRLGWGPVFQLLALDDEEKAEALRLRAANRGMDMPEEVARYLLQRAPRDMHALFVLLERLDEGSLAAQRKLTIPFVRSLLH